MPKVAVAKIDSIEDKKKRHIKLEPKNWLNIFDNLDLKGPSRALFSNLQLNAVDDKRVIFQGSDIFTDNINEKNKSDLILSMKNNGYVISEIEIKKENTTQTTPSLEWQKKRNLEIKDFKNQVLRSSLVTNLNDKYNAKIVDKNIDVIDHEE